MPRNALYDLADSLISKKSLLLAIELRLEFWANEGVRYAAGMSMPIGVDFPASFLFDPIYDLLCAMDMYYEADAFKQRLQELCKKVKAEGGHKTISRDTIPHVDDYENLG